MASYDVIIVGSGPSGAAAALALSRRQSKRVVVLDEGQVEENHFNFPSLTSALDARTMTSVSALLGPKFEAIDQLEGEAWLHPKLTAAAARHVLRGRPFSVLNSRGVEIFKSNCSHALGGMSNAWGGQLLRYTNRDVQNIDWPFEQNIFSSAYDALERHIGISGVVDDASDLSGGGEIASKPLDMVPSAALLLDRYSRRAARFCPSPIYLGRARLAVNGGGSLLSVDAHSLGETEFLETNQPGLYTAQKTITQLVSERKISYRAGSSVIDWKENEDSVAVRYLDSRSGEKCEIVGKNLFLACGAMQSAALVAVSLKKDSITVPFVDHSPVLLPLWILGALPIVPDKSYPIQLIGGLRAQRDFFSIYYPGGMFWSSLMRDLPCSYRFGARTISNILRRLLVAQIWYPSAAGCSSSLKIDKHGGMIIREHEARTAPPLARHVYEFAKLGAITVPALSKMTPTGWGFHHAGTLPSRPHPGELETHLDGRLWNSRRVRVIDASVFPVLPAKNHSLTMMANAYRIASELHL